VAVAESRPIHLYGGYSAYGHDPAFGRGDLGYGGFAA